MQKCSWIIFKTHRSQLICVRLHICRLMYITTSMSNNTYVRMRSTHVVNQQKKRKRHNVKNNWYPHHINMCSCECLQYGSISIQMGQYVHSGIWNTDTFDSSISFCYEADVDLPIGSTSVKQSQFHCHFNQNQDIFILNSPHQTIRTIFGIIPTEISFIIYYDCLVKKGDMYHADAHDWMYWVINSYSNTLVW